MSKMCPLSKGAAGNQVARVLILDRCVLVAVAGLGFQGNAWGACRV